MPCLQGRYNICTVYKEEITCALSASKVLHVPCLPCRHYMCYLQGIHFMCTVCKKIKIVTRHLFWFYTDCWGICSYLWCWIHCIQNRNQQKLWSFIAVIQTYYIQLNLFYQSTITHQQNNLQTWQSNKSILSPLKEMDTPPREIILTQHLQPFLLGATLKTKKLPSGSSFFLSRAAPIFKRIQILRSQLHIYKKSYLPSLNCVKFPGVCIHSS